MSSIASSCQPHDLRAGVEKHVIVLLCGYIGALYLAPPIEGFHSEPQADDIARHALAKLGPRLSELVVAYEVSAEQMPSDEQNARDMAKAVVGDPSAGHYLELLRCEARQLVERSATAILRVADALEHETVLTGEQVVELIHPPSTN